MQYINVIDPAWANADHTAIAAVLETADGVTQYFIAYEDDDKGGGALVFQDINSAKYGPIADFIDPSLAISESVLASDIRAARDGKIDQVQWLVSRHIQQVAMATATTLTSDEYIGLLQYIQALRDVPAQDGFPQSIDWPILPAFGSPISAPQSGP